MNWSSHKSSGSAPLSALRRVFSGSHAEEPAINDQTTNADVQAGKPAYTVRDLDENGFVRYNVGADAKASIFVAKVSDAAYFEDEQEYSPRIVPINDDLGTPVGTPAVTVETVVPETSHSQPSDIFQHALSRQQLEPIDFEEIRVIRKPETRSKEALVDEQPIAGLYSEGNTRQNESNVCVQNIEALPPAIMHETAVTSGLAAVKPVEQQMNMSVVPVLQFVAPQPVLAEPTVLIVIDEVRDLLVAVRPEVADDEAALTDDAAEDLCPEDGLESYDCRFHDVAPAGQA